MILETTPIFFEKEEKNIKNKRSFSFLFGYIIKYKNHFFTVIVTLLIGCAVQLILPFLTQMIVDIGISNKKMNIIWLILLGQFILTLSRTIADFIRNKILLHISIKINISLVSDFLIKLLKLPMSF